MTNAVASAIFCARNIDKSEKGEYGRIPVFIGQGKNVINSIMTLDNAVGKTTQSAVEAVHKMAKAEPLLGTLGKGIEFASKNINFLICVSGGVKVATADDKVSAAIEQTSALGAMFGAEYLMKKHMDSLLKVDGISHVNKKIQNLAASQKEYKALPKMIRGILFVVGSCAGFGIGEKIGKSLTDKYKHNYRQNFNSLT